MEDCIFCKIVRGEMPSYKIAENEEFLAFLDIKPLVPAHTLIIPKKHYDHVWDMNNVGELYKFAQEVVLMFKKAGFEHVDSLLLGRGVSHAHIHLLPHNMDVEAWREVLATLESGCGGDKLTEEEAVEIQNKLKNINEESK